MAGPSHTCPRICLVADEFPPDVSGGAVSARRLAGCLCDAGYDVHVATPRFGAHDNGLVHRTLDGMTVHDLLADLSAPPLDRVAWCVKALVRLDREIGFDLFHGFFLPMAYLCLRPAGARPVIASLRGDDAVTHLRIPAYRPFVLEALERAAWVTSVNRAYLDLAGQEVDLAGRGSVIYNSCPRLEGGSWIRPGEGEHRVGTLGPFRRFKDTPLLVRAYAHVPPALRSRLDLLGFFSEAVEEEWSHTLAGELGVAGEMEVTGPLAWEAVPERLRGLAVYVQPSAYEGLPNGLLEAAALGVPLVATAVGGMAEILEDGVSALLVPHGDPRWLGAAITRVLADPDLAGRLSRGALDLAARYTPERESREWLEVYDRLLPRV